MALKRTQLCEAVVGGFDLVVSRTGYTGEKMAFELFVHPDQAAALFEALLSAGEPLRVEALRPGGARFAAHRGRACPSMGTRWAGSNQRGDRDLGVAEGRFWRYVKTYKPWFIGRQAYLAREAAAQGVVARFRFTEKGVRMAHGRPGAGQTRPRDRLGDQLRGRQPGFLTGQAYLELKSAEEGTPILIYQGAPGSAGKAPAELLLGDRLVLPTPATVVSRFPK
jgi:glycine hydroxymethyltransferase